MSILQNRKLCCGVSGCENKRGKGFGADCKILLAFVTVIFVILCTVCQYFPYIGWDLYAFLHFLQEEQRVIEAKIRMRQQELQDDKERTQKRSEVSSSSTSIAPGELECGPAAGILLLKLW
jgi:hypothetical protein